MLKLYHSPISPNSRRVWITLLEKGLDFELIEVQLSGEQFEPQFLAMNPFHHIPVLVDDDLTLVESLAMLDYLEAKYPTPTMLPDNPQDLATVRMVQLVVINELLPGIGPLFPMMLGLPAGDANKIEQAQQKAATVLTFFEGLLDDRPFFGCDRITLAEPVAGTVLPWLTDGGVPLSDYPKLNDWCDRLTDRLSWQTTQATPEMMQALKMRMKAMMEKKPG